MHLGKDICVSWKDFLFLSIRRLYFVWFLREIYMEKVLQEHLDAAMNVAFLLIFNMVLGLFD